MYKFKFFCYIASHILLVYIFTHIHTFVCIYIYVYTYCDVLLFPGTPYPEGHAQFKLT